MLDHVPVIPKTIHYVWVGAGELPDTMRQYVEGWRRLNPNFEVKEWNERNIDFSHPFIQAAYASHSWASVADFVRIDILKKFGGIYLDADVELIRSLDNLINDECFLGFQLRERHSDWVANTVIGAIPNQNFIVEVHNCFDGMVGWRNWESETGPRLITKLLVNNGLETYSDNTLLPNGVRLYGSKYFYPYSWLESYSPECISTETVALHHWDYSWRRGKDFWKRLRRDSRRSMAALAPALLCSYERKHNERARWGSAKPK
jgi:mannosyltransferase OCH1-like enzyme